MAAGGDAADLADRFDGTLEFGTAGLRGALGAGPEPDEPGRRAARRGRAGGLPPDHGAAPRQLRGDRLRRPAQLRRLRPRHRRGDDRRRAEGAAAAAPAADPAAGLRHPRARLRRRRDGDRQPQPAAGQRLQGLPRRRQPDRAAGRRRDRRADRGGRRASPTCRAAPAGTVLGEEIVDRYLDTDRRPGRRRAPRPRRSSTPRCTASAATLGAAGARDGRVRRAARRRRSRRSPTPTSPPSPSPTPRSRARWTWRWRWPSERGADLVVANDPDADRCAAAVPGAHGWRMLRGDEVGALLAAHLLAQGRDGRLRHLDRLLLAAGQDGRAPPAQPYAETLTGFKWIGRVEGLAFGYEEALGYCCDPEHVQGQGRRLGAAAALRAGGRGQGRGAHPATTSSTTSPAQHGLHATDQLSVRVSDLAADPRGDGDAARHPAGGPGRPGRASGSTTSSLGSRRPAADRRAALPPGRRAPGSWSGRAAPSRSSSATSRSSSR